MRIERTDPIAEALLAEQKDREEKQREQEQLQKVESNVASAIGQGPLSPTLKTIAGAVLKAAEKGKLSNSSTPRRFSAYTTSKVTFKIGTEGREPKK